MDVVQPENSSNTCWEGGEIRILSGFHFTRGVFGFDWLRHAGAQPELPALPDPQTSQKIEIETRDHSENASECPLDPDFHPVVVKITKNDFLGDFRAKKVPKWALRAAGWDPQSPSKIDWVKYFLVQLSISSKKPLTPGWLRVPKMYLTRKFIIGKAFYPAPVRAAGGVAYGPYISHMQILGTFCVLPQS